MAVHLHPPTNQQTTIEHPIRSLDEEFNIPIWVMALTPMNRHLNKWRELLDQQSEKFG
jgi:diaminopimelate decarboxylase